MFGKKSGASGKQKSKTPKQALEVNFFVAHGEKILFSLVALGLAYLVYEGIGGKGYDPQRQPQQLSENADRLLQSIRNGDPWPQLEKERSIAHNFAQRTDEARQPSDPADYPVPVMEVQDKGAYQKRGDPELKAPIKVIGQSIVGMIPVEAPDNAADPFEDREDAKKLKGKTKDSGRRGRGNTQPGFGSDAAGSGDLASGALGGGLGAGGLGGPGGEILEPKRLFPSTYNRGFPMGMAPAGMGSMGGMDGSGMAGGMAAGGMASGGMASGGMASGGMATGGTPGSLTGGPNVKPKKYHPKVMYFNAVTALVQHEELVKEYEAQLRESSSYNPMRDRPIYLSFEVQRVEVTSKDQQINEADWKPITDATKQLALVRTWLPKYPMQQVPDVIDPMAAERALTIPLPPILIRDYRQFAKHPDIDWMWDAGMSRMQQQPPADPNQNKQPDDGGILPGERGPIGGMAGMGGMMGGMDGSGMMGSGMMGGMDGSGMMGAGMMGGMDGSGMMGSGMMGGMDGSGMMGGYGMTMLPPKFKMIRFYDVLSEKDVRKTYRYRVRVMMEDPNYPSDIWPAPRNQDLKDDVFGRVAKLRKKEDPEAEAIRKENLTAKPNTPRKVYNRTKRFTPWSEPSNSIYVVGNEDVFIGKFPAKRTNEPTADAVLVKLDARGAYLPMFSFPTEGGKEEKRLPQFKRGAVLVYPKVTTQFAHPVTTVIKEWPDYQFNGGSTVVDIRGNEPLALSDAKDDPLTDNGEMMVWMSDGHVKVTNEFDDAFWYRAFTLADEREMMEKAGGGGFMGGDMSGASGGFGGSSGSTP